MPNELSPSIEAHLLSHFPKGTQVVEARSYRPDYLPYPMYVHLRTPSDNHQRCVVKIGTHEGIAREFQALRLLAPHPLPVPQVLVEPTPLPSEDRSLLVVSELPGRALPWCGTNSLAEADLACRLVVEGVARLHQLTDRLLERDAGRILPHHTLQEEYGTLISTAGEWMNLPLFRRAVEMLEDALPEVTTPLVFSNGDYNPLNFLYEGQTLCGFVDFERACFENPHVGFAKFVIWRNDAYGWGTGVKAGLVERYLYARNVSRRDFAPLLVLRCLSHLIREVSLEDAKDTREREHRLQILAEGLQSMQGG